MPQIELDVDEISELLQSESQAVTYLLVSNTEQEADDAIFGTQSEDKRELTECNPSGASGTEVAEVNIDEAEEDNDGSPSNDDDGLAIGVPGREDGSSKVLSDGMESGCERLNPRIGLSKGSGDLSGFEGLSRGAALDLVIISLELRFGVLISGR